MSDTGFLIISVLGVLFVLLYIFILKVRKYEEKKYMKLQENVHKQNSDFLENKQSRSSKQYDEPTDFEKLAKKISDDFIPTATYSEEECEKQLLEFLHTKFPGRVLTKGQTKHGRRIDLVFEGTDALELVLVSNEGKLLSLINQVNTSKEDFSQIIVILIDMDEVSQLILNNYVQQLEGIGIKTIVKKGY